MFVVSGQSWMIDMELYIHYPFCAQKCRYCDFLSAPADRNVRSRYMDALIEEIRTQAPVFGGQPVETLFIGGGTPSLMPPEDLARLMEAVRSDFQVTSDAELTMEANPGTLSSEFLETMVRCGINRLSLGLQSADDRELKLLGRIHTFEQFCESFHLARAAGLKNINVDLMSALPGQTLSSWQRTLEAVLALEPEHISAYSLIIEEGTPFYEIYGGGGGSPPLPDEDTERQMYAWTKTALAARGYGRYEISNYARPGRECRHNIGYWRRRNYLGLGLGASSLMDGRRFTNTRDMEKYLSVYDPQAAKNAVIPPGNVYEDEQVLTTAEQMEEFMFLGLRLMEGVCDPDFRAAFGISMLDIYGEVIQKHCGEGLLHYIEEKGKLCLTERGIDVSNYVLSDFLLD